MEVCLSRKPTIRRRLFPLQLASDIPVMTCCVNTVQKVDVAQRAEDLLSCIQIYGCATRGTKFLHIRKEVTTVAYWMAAQNCSGFGIWVSALREGFSATEWRYARLPRIRNPADL
jgi:hypothetical protein